MSVMVTIPTAQPHRGRKQMRSAAYVPAQGSWHAAVLHDRLLAERAEGHSVADNKTP